MSALIRALQSSLTGAQAALDRRQEQTIERMIDLAEDGSPEFVTWRCPSLSGDGRMRTHELLRVPWASLSSPTMMNISELSVQLKHPDRFTLEGREFDAGHDENVSDSRTTAQNGTASSIKIRLQGKRGQTGTIVIDDVRVGTIGPRGLVCETQGREKEPDGTEQRQEEMHRRSRMRSKALPLAIAIVALIVFGLTAWLVL